MAWATPDDITARWVGSNLPTDTDLMTALISDAEQIILAEYPGIQDRIDGGSLPVERVIFVVTQMVSRVLRNPEGLSSWQQTTGPFSQSRTFNAMDGSLGIYLQDNEVKLLAPNRGGKAFEIDLAPNASNPETFRYPDELYESRNTWENVTGN